MTVLVSAAPVRYDGNNVTTIFPFLGVIFADSDLEVTYERISDGLVTTLLLTTDYSVENTGALNGGNVVTVVPVPSTHRIAIRVSVPATQPTSFRNQSGFLRETHEEALDRLERQVQKLERKLNLCVRLPALGVDDLMAEMASKSAFIGKYFAGDALGNPFPASGTGNDSALRTDLASTTLGANGSLLVGFKRTETGAAARTIRSKLLEWVTPFDFGAVGDGSTNDATALQNALNSLGTNGGTLYLPPGFTFKSTANLNVPVPASGQGPVVDIQGSGWSSAGLLFDGGAVTTGLTYSGSGFSYCGTIRDLKVRCINTAARCVTWTNVNKPKADRCFFHTAAGAAIKVDTAIMIELDSCLIIGCGSATEGSVEIDNCTTFKWDHSYISGGNTTIGGLIIGRTFHTTMIGGAIESCGIGLRVGHRTDGAIGATTGEVIGVDFENPGNGNPYIEIGQGINTIFITAWKFSGCNGSPSGTATVPYAVRLYRTIGFEFETCNFALAGASTAFYELDGTNNFGVTIHAHRHLYGTATPWVRRNAVQVKAAGPHYEWNSDAVPRGLIGSSLPALTGATVSILVHPTQGGYYGVASMVNGGAVTVTALTGGEAGMEITLIASNGNTTLTHSTGTADQFNCTAGANLVMAANRPYRFRHSGTNWVQFA